MFVDDLENYIPKNDYSAFIKKYFSLMKRYGVKKFIKNIDVEIKFIEIDNLLIPLSFGNYKDNCYTTSILGSIKYAREEILKDNNKIKVFFYKYFLDILYLIVKYFKIEDNVFVFNLFLSTILYPDLEGKTIVKILNFLKEKYPDKAVIFRSINNDLTGKLKNILDDNNFNRIVGRQIFYFNKENYFDIINNKSFKEDKRTFEKNNFTIKNKNFTIENIKKVKNCYDDLYIRKYSNLNPNFTIDYYKNILKCDNFSINTLIDQDIEAVYGYYKVGNQCTTPIFGYNLENNLSKKLYKQITYLTILDCFKKVSLINHSSGVGKFKLNRGAKMDIEYIMFYIEHLNFFRKIPWFLLNKISKYIIEKELKNNIY